MILGCVQSEMECNTHRRGYQLEFYFDESCESSGCKKLVKSNRKAYQRVYAEINTLDHTSGTRC